MASPILPDEVIIEILSRLPAKSLLRFKCANKSFKSLISDAKFVKLHLERSPASLRFLTKYQSKNIIIKKPIVFPCPESCLLGDSLSQIAENEYRYISRRFFGFDTIIGSCNGLVCLSSTSRRQVVNDKVKENRKFLLWNPATRQIFFDRNSILRLGSFVNMFGFGYDNVSHTYKVVAIHFPFTSVGGLQYTSSNQVQVWNISENSCWRNIQSFPALSVSDIQTVGVYLKSTLNWVVLPYLHNGPFTITFSEIVIVSLDLGNETYTKVSLPATLSTSIIDDYSVIGNYFHSDSDKILGVLKDCLCLFLRRVKTNRFTIWQMKKFMDGNSWEPLLDISVCQLHIRLSEPWYYLQPLCLFEDGTILIILRQDDWLKAILYNGRDNTVKLSEVSSGTIEFYTYIPSLVSPRNY